MKLSCAACLLLTLLATTCSSMAVSAPPLLGVFDIEPWGFHPAGRQPQGIYVELATALAVEAGLAGAEVRVEPYARISAEMKAGGFVYCFMFADEAILEGALPVLPLRRMDIVVVTPAAHPMRSLDELEGKTVGTLFGTRSTPAIDANPRIIKHPVATPLQQLKMLQLGRVDAVVGVRETIEYTLRKLGAGAEFSPPVAVAQAEAYLHVSKRHYSEELRARLAGALERLQARGEIDRIFRNHLKY